MLDFPPDDDGRGLWGDWIDHFGGGCPLLVGDIFQPVLRLKHWDNAVMTLPSALTRSGQSHDIWIHPADAEYAVIKYRVLKDTQKIIEMNESIGLRTERLRDFCRLDFFPQKTA